MRRLTTPPALTRHLPLHRGSWSRHPASFREEPFSFSPKKPYLLILTPEFPNSPPQRILKSPKRILLSPVIPENTLLPLVENPVFPLIHRIRLLIPHRFTQPPTSFPHSHVENGDNFLPKERHISVKSVTIPQKTFAFVSISTGFPPFQPRNSQPYPPLFHSCLWKLWITLHHYPLDRPEFHRPQRITCGKLLSQRLFSTFPAVFFFPKDFSAAHRSFPPRRISLLLIHGNLAPFPRICYNRK